MKREDIIPPIMRPQMYTGVQGVRRWQDWIADAIIAYLDTKGITYQV